MVTLVESTVTCPDPPADKGQRWLREAQQRESHCLRLVPSRDMLAADKNAPSLSQPRCLCVLGLLAGSCVDIHVYCAMLYIHEHPYAHMSMYMFTCTYIHVHYICNMNTYTYT